MTNAEWDSGTDPFAMLKYLRGKSRATDRKLRLFACGSCRLSWPSIPEGTPRRIVEIAERIADGVSVERAIEDLHQEIAAWREQGSGRDKFTDFIIRTAVRATLDRDARWAARDALLYGRLLATSADPLGIDISPRFAAILRDVIPRPLMRDRKEVNSTCKSSTVTTFGKAIYTDRAFDRLPILADALEEAGCTDADVLSHCRGPGPHVRGCWVVDLILGKE